MPGCAACLSPLVAFLPSSFCSPPQLPCFASSPRPPPHTHTHPTHAHTHANTLSPPPPSHPRPQPPGRLRLRRPDARAVGSAAARRLGLPLSARLLSHGARGQVGGWAGAWVGGWARAWVGGWARAWVCDGWVSGCAGVLCWAHGQACRRASMRPPLTPRPRTPPPAAALPASSPPGSELLLCRCAQPCMHIAMLFQGRACMRAWVGRGAAPLSTHTHTHLHAHTHPSPPLSRVRVCVCVP